MESKKIKQSYETKQKQIHRYRKQISACNWGKVSEEKQDTYEFKRNKLLRWTLSALVTSRIVSLGNELYLILLKLWDRREGVYFDMKCIQLVSLIQSTAHPLLSPDLWEELLAQPGDLV